MRHSLFISTNPNLSTEGHKKSPIKGRMPSNLWLLGIYYEKVIISNVITYVFAVSYGYSIDKFRV